ncbi:MAG: FAD-dependent monooxygenase [Mycobacteriales bacterium]
MRQAVVVGAGLGGLCTSLLLADAGWSVTVVDRDEIAAPTTVDDSSTWQRRGVPQFRQSHGFIPLFTRELRSCLTEVYDDLLASGATEIRLTDNLPPAISGQPLDGDDELVFLAARRSTVDWALLRAAASRRHLQIRAGTAVAGLAVSRGRVTGVVLADGTLPTDLVVDAGGRRSPLLKDLAPQPDRPADVDCGMVYNTRFYRLLDGADPGPLNRGFAAGGIFAGYSCVLFPHDNRTFSIACGRLPDDTALKPMREVDAFEAAVRAIPLVAPWREPGRSEPTSPVVPMAGLTSHLNLLAADAPTGLIRLADAACTTNPAFGRGAALALLEAHRLAELLVDLRDLAHVRAAFDEFLTADLVPWHADAVAADQARTAAWRAAVAGVPSQSPAMRAPYPMPVLAAAAAVDKHVWQAVMQTAGMLRKPAELAGDDAVHERVTDLMGAGWRPEPPPAPSHAELAEVLREAVSSTSGR